MPGGVGNDAGGLLPKSVWDIKKNIGDNVNWNDPTQIGLKSIGQEIAGRRGLSPLIENAVPEMRTLNPRYSNLSDLQDSAIAQANRRNPFVNLRKASELFGGGAGAMFGHNPYGLIPGAADVSRSDSSTHYCCFCAARYR